MKNVICVKKKKKKKRKKNGFDFTDDKLKCYMCTSLTDPSCDTDLSTEDIKECTLNNMDSFKQRIQQHNDLNKIAVIFEVDKSQYYQASAPMACAKMILKGTNREFIIYKI